MSIGSWEALIASSVVFVAGVRKIDHHPQLVHPLDDGPAGLRNSCIYFLVM